MVQKYGGSISKSYKSDGEDDSVIIGDNLDVLGSGDKDERR